jgi:hypothetical protein
VRVELNGRSVRRTSIGRGQRTTLKVRVPPAGGQVRLAVHPSFVPDTNGDQRELTAMLVKAELTESSGEVVHAV